MAKAERTKPTPLKREPGRTCAGCHAKKPQHEMLRIASQEGSTPVVDKEYSLPGRGTYLCFDGACWQRAQKRRAIERALKLREGVPRVLKDEIDRLLSSGATRSKPDEKSPSASPK